MIKSWSEILHEPYPVICISILSIHLFIIHAENEEEAARIIESGENANVLDGKQKTPMHIASEKVKI